MIYDIKNNQNYILTSNYGNLEPIKIFDLCGKKIKEIKNSNKNNVLFMDIYYDKQKSKYYIITGNEGCVKSYDYNQYKIYFIYCDNDNKAHYNIIINNNDKNFVKLIELSEDGKIRIWNFHSRELLKKIYVSEFGLYGICLWDNDNLFVGCADKSIKLINLNSWFTIKNLNGHKASVINIKKIKIEKYGECLISQGDFDEQIKLWINKKNVKQ